MSSEPPLDISLPATENQQASSPKGRPHSEEDIHQYRCSVQNRIINNNEELFENHGATHASVVIESLILSAKKHIDIYCRHLSAQIYNGIVPAFILAYVRGVTIRVITEIPPESSMAQDFLVSQHLIKTVSPPLGVPHFVLVDGIRFRQETEQEEKKAIVCTHTSDSTKLGEETTKDLAARIQKLFNKKWADGHIFSC